MLASIHHRQAISKPTTSHLMLLMERLVQYKSHLKIPTFILEYGKNRTLNGF